MKFRQLGDVLLMTPLLAALKEGCPQATLDVAVYEEAAELVAHHPAVSRVLTVKRGEKGWRFYGQVMRGGYDLVINLTEGDRGAIAALLSRAKVRVGFARRRDTWFYTHIVKNCPTPRHTVERQLDVARRLGLVPTDKRVRLEIPSEVEAAVRARVGERQPIVVHPFSRWKFKCWPHMPELIRRLEARGERVIVTGMAEDGEMGGERWVGSLLELGALLKCARALVTVDSLPLHMASAVGCPTVAIFGPTSEVAWGPWMNPRARVVSAQMSCRPCLQDGCGGSKRSECLWALGVSELERLTQVVASGVGVGEELGCGAREENTPLLHQIGSIHN